MRIVYPVLVFFFLLCPSTAAAQYGVFVADGLVIGVDVSSTEPETIGASIERVAGSFGLGAHVSRSSLRMDPPSVVGMGAHVALYPIRQQDGAPLSVSVVGRSTYLDIPQNFRDPDPDLIPTRTGDGQGYILALKTGVSRAVPVTGNAAIIPSTELGVVRSHTEPDGLNRHQTEFPRFTVRLPLRLKTSGDFVFVIMASATVGEGASTHGISVSVGLPSSGE